MSDRDDEPAKFTPLGDNATFEPLDKLDQLKEEMAAKFKGMDKNLAKIDELAGQSKSPIANAKPRMKSMMDDLAQGVLDIKPFVPKSFTMFHGLANILGMMQGPEKARQDREKGERDQDSIFRNREARTARDEAYTGFLNTWKMPPDIAMNLGSTSSAASLAGAAGTLGGFARPPGPASTFGTTPPAYAGVLAGGGGGQSTGGSSGGSELRDVLSVLREILDAIRESKLQGGGDESDDESESVENRRPFFKKAEEQPAKMDVKETTLQSGPVPSVTRSPQQTAQDSISATESLAAAARFLAAL